jgi:ABC-type lipoprotein release transport system permease subunit
MMSNIKIAWRNLWRNRRRTMITSASVLFAVFFALIFRSLQLGSYDKMFRDVIESYTGYIQVQQSDFWEEKTVDNTFPYDPVVDSEIKSDPNVITTVPRFESFALASSGPKTKGVLVMGVDPEKEQYLSGISDKLVQFRMTTKAVQRMTNDAALPESVKAFAAMHEGNSYTSSARLQMDLGIKDKDAAALMPVVEQYTRFRNGSIEMGEPGVWVGDRLSQYLELNIGDTLVLIGQGYHATTAAGKYPIKGIVKLPLPDLDNKVVYLPLDICQLLYNAGGNLTSLALHIADNEDKAVVATVDRIGRFIPDGQRVLEWREMNEVLVSQLEADNYSGMIMIGILYLVIAFGVFGTVLMLTAERKREFGVMVAIGMQKRKLASVMTLEMLFIGFLGMLAGSLIATLFILYGVDHPIVFKGEMAKMYEDFGMDPVMAFQGINVYFIWQLFIVCLMVMLSMIYPLRKIFGMKVVNSLRA